MKSHLATAVKICGITQIEQALEIASKGADAIGVIGVESSPRFLSEKKRRELFYLLSKRAPEVKRVWVVADLDINIISEGLIGKGIPSIIQLHGNESKETCRKLKKLYPNFEWWKSFQINQRNDLSKAKEYQYIVDSILLDSWSRDSLGGTGNRISIELLEEVNLNCPWWLAGGISPDCILETLSKVNPYGVDASSKLEKKPGVKDMEKVNSLIKKVKL